MAASVKEASDDEHNAGKLFLLEKIGISGLLAGGHAATYRNPDWAA